MRFVQYLQELDMNLKDSAIVLFEWNLREVLGSNVKTQQIAIERPNATTHVITNVLYGVGYELAISYIEYDSNVKRLNDKLPIVSSIYIYAEDGQTAKTVYAKIKPVLKKYSVKHKVVDTTSKLTDSLKTKWKHWKINVAGFELGSALHIKTDIKNSQLKTDLL